jgi:hypothetical protein
MPRIIVTTDSAPGPADAGVFFDEHVQSVHLSTGHAASQLVERLAWAISDAETVEHHEPGAGTNPPRLGQAGSRRLRPTHRGRRVGSIVGV